MELLFTDGETFFHEEKRDITYDFHYVDEDAPAVKVVGSDPEGRYTVTKEMVADPHHSVVLMNVKITGDEAVLARMKCYALLAPHLHGGGAGNSARSVLVAGKRVLLAWHGPVSLAMGADCGFTRSSCGYVGASDGYQDLAADMKMTWTFGQALDGNIAVTGEIDVARYREFTIAIGLGDGHHAALSEMGQALAMPYEKHCERFVEQWMRARTPTDLAGASMDAGRLSRISHNVILTHEDKTFSGAFIASASIPWGMAKGDDDLGGYHLVWTRCWRAARARRRCGRWCTWRVRSIRTAASRRISGSMGRRTGRGFNWTRWRFRSCWRGGFGSRTAWRSSTCFHLWSRRRASWCAMRRSRSRSGGRRTRDIRHRRWRR
jgi:glucoamylase